MLKDDGVNVFKGMVRDPRFLPGAGAVEVELASRLSSFGDATPGLDQYAIKKVTLTFLFWFFTNIPFLKKVL